MLSLFNNGGKPVKRVSGMDLYRFGNRIDPLWRIKKEDTYRDIGRICEEARLELQHLLDSTNYSHVLDLSKKPIERLAKNLARLLKFRHEKNEAIGGYEHDRLQDNLRDFEDKYSIDIKKGLMFVATPKGTHDLKLLLEHGERNFDKALPSVCPEAIPEIQAATRCLVYAEFTASVFHFHRAHEIVVKKYMDHLGLEIPKNGTLTKYVSAIKTKKNLPDGLTRLLDLSKGCRNPIMHPEIYVEKLEDANSLYIIVLKSVGIMAREMAAGKLA